MLRTFWIRLACAMICGAWTAVAFASQGPGVSDGTASPELQRGIILAFCGFFAMIFLAFIGRRK